MAMQLFSWGCCDRSKDARTERYGCQICVRNGVGFRFGWAQGIESFERNISQKIFPSQSELKTE